MRISTNEFLLGSLNDMLAQQSTVNQLNREIATGQTMLDASSDPGGAAQMVGVTSQIAHLTYDSANARRRPRRCRAGSARLQQVTTLLDAAAGRSAVAAANGTANASDRQSLIASAQTVLQQLVSSATRRAERRLPFLRLGIEHTGFFDLTERPSRLQRRHRQQTRSRSRRRST